MLSKDEALLLISFTSAVTGHPVSTEAVTFSPLTQPILFWGLSAAPITMPFILFNRFIRGTVGPLFINLALMMTVSTLMVVDLLLFTSPGMWLAVHIKGVFGASTRAALMVIGLTLSAVVAWFGLQWIARRYRLKRLSDQTFLFDALWLSVSLWLTVYLMGADSQFRFHYLLGLLPFALYRTTLGYGLKRLAARAERCRKRACCPFASSGRRADPRSCSTCSSHVGAMLGVFSLSAPRTWPGATSSRMSSSIS